MKIFDPQSKILANIDYVKKLLTTGYSPPVLVEVDPSNTCNHACKFCISSYIHLPESKDLETFNKDILPRDILLKLGEDLIKIQTKAINWTGGGEPTVNPALKEAIELIGKSSVKMGMFTNGTLLDKHDLFKTIVENLEWIRFSVDAGTKESYNSIRRVRPSYDWDKMSSNLKTLIKDNYAGIDIGVGFVITPDNYTEIIDFANYFKEFDIRYCQFKPEIVNRERENGVQRTIEFFKKLDPLLQQAKDILGDKFQINGYKLDDLKNDTELYGRTYTKCLGSQLSPCVGADGNIYVCTNHRGYKQYSYGSLYESNFIDIWSDIKIRERVLSIIEDKEKFSACTKLCKPHESNKKLFQLYKEYEVAVDKELFFNELENEAAKLNIQHKEFI